MKVVVLGASGQIGSIVYNGLKNFHDVIGTSRLRSDALVQFDPFKDNWSALGKTDVLINCIGQITPTTDSTFYHIHVALTKLIITHRGQLGNPRIVQISALGASPNHDVEFLKTKGISDDFLLQHPNTAVIRPSIVCTHRTMIVRKMRMLSDLSRFLFGVIPVPEGFLKTRIQPIMPQDLADLIRHLCVHHKVKLLNAVGSERLSFGELLQMLIENRNRRFKTFEVSRMISDLFVKNVFSRLFPGIINAQQYQLLFYDNVADVNACTQLLGRMPLSARSFFVKEFSGNGATYTMKSKMNQP